jgi:hypothetical protein
LIAIREYLADHPNSPLATAFSTFGVTAKLDKIWNEKITEGLISTGKEVGLDSSSLNSHILEPGSIKDPLSILRASLIFLFGPIPFYGEPGIAAAVAALESPIWWVFYAYVFFKILKNRKANLLRDQSLLLCALFMLGFIIFSSLIQVNLGTAFRHRSVLLVPLTFIAVRVGQLNKHNH